MLRLLHGSVTATGKDHENIGSDEFLRATSRQVHLVVDTAGDELPIHVEPFRWGGECRIEVHLNAVANDDGLVQVHGFTSFFEGTSEDTPHERDREVLNFFVRKTTTSNPHPTVVGAHMQNDGDVGDVTISLSNVIMEEE